MIGQVRDELVQQVRPPGRGPGSRQRPRRTLGQREEPPGRIPGLRHAVGVEQQLFALADSEHARLAPPVRQVEQPERRSRARLDKGREPTAQQQRRRMPAADQLRPGAALIPGSGKVHQQGGNEPFRMLGPRDQRVQPDRDTRQAGLGDGQLAPRVEHGQAGPVRGRAGAHDVADEQPDSVWGRHRVVNVAALALRLG